MWGRDRAFVWREPDYQVPQSPRGGARGQGMRLAGEGGSVVYCSCVLLVDVPQEDRGLLSTQ